MNIRIRLVIATERYMAVSRTESVSAWHLGRTLFYEILRKGRQGPIIYHCYWNTLSSSNDPELP